MKVAVVPRSGGLISHAGQIQGQQVDDALRIVEVESLTIPPNTAAVVTEDGTVEIVPNWVGSGPWFDQNADAANREVPIEINQIGIAPAAHWAMTPRPETKAEIKAREAEAAKAEAARIATITVSRYQFRRALFDAGKFDAAAEAFTTGDALSRLNWDDAPRFKRSEMGAIEGLFSAAELDALFVAASKI